MSGMPKSRGKRGSDTIVAAPSLVRPSSKLFFFMKATFDQSKINIIVTLLESTIIHNVGFQKKVQYQGEKVFFDDHSMEMRRNYAIDFC